MGTNESKLLDAANTELPQREPINNRVNRKKRFREEVLESEHSHESMKEESNIPIIPITNVNKRLRMDRESNEFKSETIISSNQVPIWNFIQQDLSNRDNVIKEYNGDASDSRYEREADVEKDFIEKSAKYIKLSHKEFVNYVSAFPNDDTKSEFLLRLATEQRITVNIANVVSDLASDPVDVIASSQDGYDRDNNKNNRLYTSKSGLLIHVEDGLKSCVLSDAKSWKKDIFTIAGIEPSIKMLPQLDGLQSALKARKSDTWKSYLLLRSEIVCRIFALISNMNACTSWEGEYIKTVPTECESLMKILGDKVFALEESSLGHNEFVNNGEEMKDTINIIVRILKFQIRINNKYSVFRKQLKSKLVIIKDRLEDCKSDIEQTIAEAKASKDCIIREVVEVQQDKDCVDKKIQEFITNVSSDDDFGKIMDILQSKSNKDVRRQIDIRSGLVTQIEKCKSEEGDIVYDLLALQHFEKIAVIAHENISDSFNNMIKQFVNGLNQSSDSLVANSKRLASTLKKYIANEHQRLVEIEKDIKSSDEELIRHQRLYKGTPLEQAEHLHMKRKQLAAIRNGIHDDLESQVESIEIFCDEFSLQMPAGALSALSVTFIYCLATMQLGENRKLKLMEFVKTFPPEVASPTKVVIDADKMKSVPLPKKDVVTEVSSSSTGGSGTSSSSSSSSVSGDIESKKIVLPIVSDIIEDKKEVPAMKVEHIDYATDYDTDYETDGEDDDKCVVM